MSEITTVEDLRRENEQLRLELATAKARAVEEAEQAQLAKLERAVPDSVILGLYYDVICEKKSSWDVLKAFADIGVPLAQAAMADHFQSSYCGNSSSSTANINKALAYASKCIGWLEAQSAAGNIYAKYFLGVFLYFELSSTMDMARGTELIKEVAETGWAEAQNRVGVLLNNVNATEAVSWYQKSAEQGHAGGQRNLGWYYEQGIGGLTRDYAQAREWCTLSSQQGFAAAARNLQRLQGKSVGFWKLGMGKLRI